MREITRCNCATFASYAYVLFTVLLELGSWRSEGGKTGRLMFHLFALTLQPPVTVKCLVVGSFSEDGVEELAVVRGAGLVEVNRLSSEGRLVLVASQQTFSCIRSMVKLRPVGSTRDMLVMGSDSGYITLVEMQKLPGGNSEELRCVAKFRVGQTGCLRTVPGEYVAADPAGRAIMTASLDGHKAAAIVLRAEATGELELREARCPRPRVRKRPWAQAMRGPAAAVAVKGAAVACPTVVCSLIGLDVAADNPAFAVLAGDDGEASEEDDELGLSSDEKGAKFVTVYALDLSTNHMVKIWRHEASRTGYGLVAVPTGAFGESGAVAVLSENWVALKHPNFGEIRAPLPRPASLSQHQGVLPVVWASPATADVWTVVLQSDHGDVYAITAAPGPAPAITVSVLGWVPPSTAIALVGQGKLLWAAMEHGDQVVHVINSEMGPGEGEEADSLFEDHRGEKGRVGDVAHEAAKVAPVFKRQPAMRLQEVTTEPGMAQITRFTTVGGKLVTMCGRGPSGSVRLLETGLPAVEELEAPLPVAPTGLWTVGSQYIILSFTSSTVVLEVGDSLTEVTDRGFIMDDRTIEVGPLKAKDGTIVQVTRSLVRRVKSGGRLPQEWRPPGRREIDKAAVHGRHMAVVVGGVDVVCFDINNPSEDLLNRGEYDAGADVSALSLADVHGLSTPLVLVGTMDLGVRVLAYTNSGIVERARVQVAQRPESLALLDSSLLVGLTSGEMQRFLVEASPGTVSVKPGRSRQVGTKPVKLVSVAVGSRPALLVISAPAIWLFYQYRGRTVEHPLAYEALDAAAPFSSARIPEGIVGVRESSLRVISLERLGVVFTENVTPLGQTPRGLAMLPSPDQKVMAVISGDPTPTQWCTGSESEKPQGGDVGEDAMQVDDAGMGTGVVGPAFSLKILDPSTQQLFSHLHLAPGEMPVSVEALRFKCVPNELFVVVGLVPTSERGEPPPQTGWIDVYRVLKQGPVLAHRTETDGAPRALQAFPREGKLFAGVGASLRVYDLGKNRLLKKCEVSIPRGGGIIRVHSTPGYRVWVTDVLRGVMCLAYRPNEVGLQLLADDPVPRLITDSSLIDETTMAGADKLGNVFFVRMPWNVDPEPEKSATVVWGPTGRQGYWEMCGEEGCPGKLDVLLDYHVGEVVTGVVKTRLTPNSSRDVLAFTTISGGIGALIPYANQQEREVMTRLELLFRKDPTLFPTYRDHFMYRSAIYPARGVVDADLIEQAGPVRRGAAAVEFKAEAAKLEAFVGESLLWTRPK